MNKKGQEGINLDFVIREKNRTIYYCAQEELLFLNKILQNLCTFYNKTTANRSKIIEKTIDEIKVKIKELQQFKFKEE